MTFFLQRASTPAVDTSGASGSQTSTVLASANRFRIREPRAAIDRVVGTCTRGAGSDVTDRTPIFADRASGEGPGLGRFCAIGTSTDSECDLPSAHADRGSRHRAQWLPTRICSQHRDRMRLRAQLIRRGALRDDAQNRTGRTDRRAAADCDVTSGSRSRGPADATEPRNPDAIDLDLVSRCSWFKRVSGN